MPWKRGAASSEVELSRVQEKIENWSEDLDGEHGVIREFREDQVERRTTVKNLNTLAKLGGVFLVIQAIVEILHLTGVLK